MLQYKLNLRQKHPEPVEVESTNGKAGKKKVMRYTDDHILRMAKWRVLTRFVRWLYKQWVRLDT